MYKLCTILLCVSLSACVTPRYSIHGFTKADKAALAITGSLCTAAASAGLVAGATSKDYTTVALSSVFIAAGLIVLGLAVFGSNSQYSFNK